MKRKKVIYLTLLVVFIFLFFIIGKYNGMVEQREKVYSAKSQIENLLERRIELIPNLVASVKGYTKHEEKILSEISDARAKMSGASSLNEKLNENDNLGSAISRLLVVIENYPNLKANEQFTGLRDELAGTENRLSTARRDYNESVKKYNQKIFSFPNNIFARVFKFEKFEYFKAKDGAQNVPIVDF
ncbi:MAG: LemA family protein [Clostridiales bacterium]|jgi:LemA protein|nr:LemA family protein [Clostridiales bacterium]